MTVYSAPHGFDLTKLRFPGGLATFDGIQVRASDDNPDAWADFTYEGLIFDPTQTYSFEFDFAFAGDPVIYFYSQITTGDVVDAWNNSNWEYLGNSYPGAPGALDPVTGPVTVPITVGPGLEDWDLAVSEGEMRVVWEIPPHAEVTAIRLIDGTTMAGGVEDVGEGGTPTPTISGNFLLSASAFAT